MSKTGRYIYDPVTKEMVKISGVIPGIKSNVYFPETAHAGYYSESCDTLFRSKNHKREVLKRKGWAEVG